MRTFVQHLTASIIVVGFIALMAIVGAVEGGF
jgi:hypothetical protein